MSLTSALNSARSGLTQAEKKIAIVSSNVNNADRAGYTRKTLTNEYVFTGETSLPINGKVVQSTSNPLLTRQVIKSATGAQYYNSIASYLGDYSRTYGNTSKDARNLQSQLSTLSGALSTLEANSGDKAAKSKVVSTAQEMASALSGLSQNVQNQRLQANNDIAASVDSVNKALEKLAKLNREVTQADAAQLSTADMEDERTRVLSELSEQIGIQYFKNPQNQIIVYTQNGTSLVGASNYNQFSYTPVGTVSVSTLYPGGFSPIVLGGVDVTTTFKTGKLGALIALRDDTLVGEQAKLDAYANTLQFAVNDVLNKGTSYPPLSTVTGSTIVAAGTAFTATGNFRVAVTDAQGVITNYTDINVATTPTVGAFVAALNGIAGVSASINADGYLEVTATAATGRIAMNPLNSTAGPSNASTFFGFNSLFTNQTGSAITLKVNENLEANYDALAVGTLNPSATLAAGDLGITSGDVSTTRALLDAMNATHGFAAGGNFAARTSTLANYASALISDAASQASAAQNQADSLGAIYSYLSQNLSNEGGVNLDEETANLTSLQSAYQANAQLISTIKNLFETLIQAVR